MDSELWTQLGVVPAVADMLKSMNEADCQKLLELLHNGVSEAGNAGDNESGSSFMSFVQGGIFFVMSQKKLKLLLDQLDHVYHEEALEELGK
ncbi:unnamed protein product, partial [Cyprideis torosa]